MRAGREKNLFLAGLEINVPKCHTIPAQQWRQLGYDADFAVGESRVPEDRWEALMASVDRMLSAHKGRVVARSLASITGTMMSMHLSWGPVTQLYTRHMYALIISVWTLLNCGVVLTEGAINELLVWKGLPRLKFPGPI